MKRIHYISGITITIFAVLHLSNHFYSLFGPNAHIKLMNDLRVVYRNIITETILLFAVAIQIISGIKLVLKKGNRNLIFLENYKFGQVYT